MMLKAWIAIFVMWAVGAGAFQLLCSEPRRWVLPAKLGLSFGLGLAILTMTLFIASLCGVKPSPLLGVLELVLLWAIGLIAKRNQLSKCWTDNECVQQISEPLWIRAMEAVLALFVIGIFLVAGGVTLLEPLVEWDVLGIWALKAKVLLHGPVIASDYFRDLSKAYSHLDYPLLWPLTIAWVWSWTGQSDLLAVKTVAVALLSGFILVSYGLLRRKCSRPLALLFTALLVGLPILLGQTSRLISDPTLAFFVLGAFVCAYFWIQSDHRDELRVASILAMGMLFTKNEGIGLWFIFVFLVTVGLIAKKETNRLFPALSWLGIVPLLGTAAWFIFRLEIAKAHEDYGGKISPAYFFKNISRIPEVFSGWGAAFLNWADWLLFWPLAILIVLLAPKNFARWPLLFLFLSATLPIVMYSYVYVVSPWNLKELMDATASRLLLQLAPLWVFLLAEQIRTSNLLPFLQFSNAEDERA